MNKFLIAGLGNIGTQYENTRHNLGFLVLDHMAKEFGLSFKFSKLAYREELRYRGKIFVLIKPTTFMNLSGKALKYWMREEKILPENLLVICDDIYLELGQIRIRPKGGHSGHNGLRNIQEVLATTAYPRMKIGIGGDFSPGKQSNYVLDKWREEEKISIDLCVEKAVKAVISFGLIGIEKTMSLFNTVGKN